MSVLVEGVGVGEAMELSTVFSQGSVNRRGLRAVGGVVDGCWEEETVFVAWSMAVVGGRCQWRLLVVGVNGGCR